GIGSRMGSGCTSGHGICGIGRLSQRSMIAAVIFLSSGIAAAVLIDLVFGGVI
ncbi:MAG: YeeE/YedE family protein, partial [Proteobacteria bacterium]|nr:YeeE/YedE family protein [Pseudomonadota bacterium]